MNKRSFKNVFLNALFFLAVLAPSAAHAQSIGLSFSQASSASTAGIAKDLILTVPNGSSVAALQWTVLYSPSQISGLSMTAGPALSGGGKSLICNDSGGTYTCLASGLSSTGIGSGVIGTLRAIGTGRATTAHLSITNAVAASPQARALTVQASSSSIALPQTALSGLSCNAVSLSAKASATCTVTLGAPAPAGGVAVAVTSNHPALTFSASTAVPAGSQSASFTVTAGAIAADQMATVSVSVAGSLQTTGIMLTAAPSLAGFSCVAAALYNNSSTQCTISLSKPASAGGLSIGLSSSLSALSIPQSATVLQGASSVSFTVTAKGFVTAQIANLTASLNSAVLTTPVSLKLFSLSSLACASASLASQSSTQCTVTMSGPAPSISTVMLSTSTNLLSIPKSVTIPANAASAVFTAAAAAVAGTRTASITAIYGPGTASASLTLGTVINLSTIVCSPAKPAPNSSGACTLTLTLPSANTTVALSATGGLILPPTVAVPNLKTIVTVPFTTAASLKQPAMVLATLNGITQYFQFSPAATQHTTLSCVEGSIRGRSQTQCSVGLSQPAPAGGLTLSLQASNASVRVPATVFVPENSTGVQFAAQSMSTGRERRVDLRVYAAQSEEATTSLAVQPVAPAGLSCSPRLLAPGEHAICSVALNVSEIPESAEIHLTSSSPWILVPPVLTTRSGQRSIRFEASASPNASEATAILTAATGGTAVEEPVSVIPGKSIQLSAPSSVSGTLGGQVRFTVTAASTVAGVPVALSAFGLPEGASFDPSTGSFSWSPSQRAGALARITFTASDSLGSTAQKITEVHLDSGLPVLMGLENSAGAVAEHGCTPGSITTLTGQGLFQGEVPLSDRSGTAFDLGGTRLLVNDTPAAVLYAAPTRVDTLCPDAPAGTPLSFVVTTAAGRSKVLHSVMQDAAPGIFTVDGSGLGQALAVRKQTAAIAALPRAGLVAQPVLPGDTLTFWVSGIRCDSVAGNAPVHVRFGEAGVMAHSIRQASESAGLCEVSAQVPFIAGGDAVPLSIEVIRKDGTLARSNSPFIAIEGR